MRPKISILFSEFFNSERAGGFVLIACTLLSLVTANSSLGEDYIQIWHTPFGIETDGIQLRRPLEFWINDGLMTVFFLLVGLEIERELYIGELSSVKNALLPVIAAIGGMIIPAGIHLSLNVGTPEQGGFGIPMATDIAFSLGVLSMLGKKVPLALKVFLTAFAIIDDIGAILVIAFFYTKGLSLLYLGGAFIIWGVLFILNRLKVHYLLCYVVPGILLWYFMLQSGVHATLSGLLLAFVIPFGDGSKKTVSYRLQRMLHKPVAFLILPLFALANTGIILGGNWYQQLGGRNSLGIGLGLIVGKPLGILLFAYAAIRLGICRLSEGITWNHIAGASMLGGIGFTMSIFITLLAFDEESIVTGSKVSVLISSFVAGLIGYIYLKMTARKNTT